MLDTFVEGLVDDETRHLASLGKDQLLQSLLIVDARLRLLEAWDVSIPVGEEEVEFQNVLRLALRYGQEISRNQHELAENLLHQMTVLSLCHQRELIESALWEAKDD